MVGLAVWKLQTSDGVVVSLMENCCVAAFRGYVCLVYGCRLVAG